MYVSGVESFVAIITALHLFILTQIKRAREQAEQHRQDAANHAKEALTLEDEFDPDKRKRNYTLQSPEQVLVRLKVEHSGFTTLNNQRFGSRFVGEVVSCLVMLIQSVCDMPCIRVSIRHYSITYCRQIPRTSSSFTVVAKLRIQLQKVQRQRKSELLLVCMIPLSLKSWRK